MICKYSDAEILRSVSFRPGIEVFCRSEAVISLVLWFLHRNIIFHGLVIFLLFDLLLSFQTLNCEENLYEISLILHPSHFYHICLPHGKPYINKLNFILDSSFLCCAWLCCHIHVHHICYASLPFCHYYVVASCSFILICLL